MQCLFGWVFKSHNKVLHQSHSSGLPDSGTEGCDKNKELCLAFCCAFLWFLHANKELECSEYTHKQSKLCSAFSNSFWVVLGIEPIVMNRKLWSGHLWPPQIISWELKFCLEHHLMALLTQYVKAYCVHSHTHSTPMKWESFFFFFFFIWDLC